jgi:predicted nucleotidyltransferase component of viral defense system
MPRRNRPDDALDPVRLREIVVLAVADDDFLMERLVLKGGTALELVHLPGVRASVDVDYSMEGDLASKSQVVDMGRRLERAIRTRMEASGFEVFDLTFEAKPSSATPGSRWGGYELQFKVIAKADFDRLKGHPEAASREAIELDAAHNRRFFVQISKYEYCKDKQLALVEGHQLYVYSLPLMVAETLRAICQQLPEYKLIGERRRRPRARDVFDVRRLVEEKSLNLPAVPEQREMVKLVFGAKEVPLEFLARVEELREFFRPDWADVMVTVGAGLAPGEFDEYFDFVRDLALRLKPAGDV